MRKMTASGSFRERFGWSKPRSESVACREIVVFPGTGYAGCNLFFGFTVNGSAHLELEEAVRLEVDCARTYEQLGRAREATGDTAGAQVAFDKACTLALTGKAGNCH